MAQDPAFLFYPGDYLRDTQCLSEKTQVAYDRIMCEHMRNICISQRQLKFFTKNLSEDEIEELKMVLTETDGGYQIQWVAESIEKRKKYSESRRKNRKNKDGKSKNICLSYNEHMENENENENVIEEEKEKRGVGEKTHFQNIVDYFNNNCPHLPRVVSLNKARRQAISARIKEYDLATLHMVIDKTAKSDFLNGDNPNGWKASFDFIIGPQNFLKVLEGNYDNKPKSQKEKNNGGGDKVKHNPLSGVKVPSYGRL